MNKKFILSTVLLTFVSLAFLVSAAQNCTTHNQTTCSDQVLYWVNSCNQLEDVKEACIYGCQNGACINATQEIEPQNQTCTDTDNGLNYYIKGTTDIAPLSAGGEAIDYCDSTSGQLIEYFCTSDGSNGGASSKFYTCPSGCSDGACLCYDSDGLDYYTLGEVNGNFQGTEGFNDKDYCVYYNPQTGTDEKVASCKNEPQNYCSIREYHCDGQNSIGLTINTCPLGCDNGACIKFNPTAETGPIEIPTILSNETVKPLSTSIDICNGCISENKCYTLGYRRIGQYCSENTTFIPQLEADSTCDNNFECSSNVCVSGKCISESFIQKILNWFKRLFGAD